MAKSVHVGITGRIRQPFDAPRRMTNVSIAAPDKSHRRGQSATATNRATAAPNKRGVEIPNSFCCLIGEARLMVGMRREFAAMAAD